MSKRQIATISCIITGKDETYEIIILETKPSGRGGQVNKIPQKPSCLNYQCSFRDKPYNCPLYKLHKQQ